MSLTEKLPSAPTKETYSVGPLNVLRTAHFYKMWLAFFAVYLMQTFINSYQKTFGMRYINDDQFFATVSTIANVMNGCSRVFWGKVYDAKGLKVTFN